MPYLALKAKSYSKARRGLLVIMPEDFRVDSMPAWHNALFVDDHGYSYFSPSLVRGGISRFSKNCQHDSLSDGVILPPFFGTVYERAQGLLTDARWRRCPKPFDTVISMWSAWFCAATLRYLNQQILVERRQSAETWKALYSASMTPILRDFVKESL